jgi:NDP-sugar pyrophosphorylase family protein
MTDPLLKYREQHKHRLNYMPWLYWSLKPKNRVWADVWQQEYQAYLMEMETVEIGQNCFISPLAHIFAEPGRKIVIGDNTFIAADCTLHGPLDIGSEVAINHHCILDGGRVGIKLHDQVRIAAYCHLYAFDHGMALSNPIYQQPLDDEIQVHASVETQSILRSQTASDLDPTFSLQPLGLSERLFRCR